MIRGAFWASAHREQACNYITPGISHVRPTLLARTAIQRIPRPLLASDRASGTPGSVRRDWSRRFCCLSGGLWMVKLNVERTMNDWPPAARAAPPVGVWYNVPPLLRPVPHRG